MLDYFYTPEDGKRVPVARMERADIVACLQAGAVEITSMDDFPPNLTIADAVHAVIKRLRLELLIRDNGWR